MSMGSTCAGENKSTMKKESNKIVIVGGGTAGIGVAAMLRNEGMVDVSIIEPKNVHYYQPLWTLVGGGVKNNAESAKPMSDIVPSGVKWVQKAVNGFDPERNQVTLDDGSSLSYDYLVVAAGIQIDWYVCLMSQGNVCSLTTCPHYAVISKLSDSHEPCIIIVNFSCSLPPQFRDKIPGVVEGLKQKDSGVVSVYDFSHCEKTWREFQALVDKPQKRLLFTMSPTAIKCAGAPQKIMWLLEDTLRDLGRRAEATIEFWTPAGAMFGVKHYSDQLADLAASRDVNTVYQRELVHVDVPHKLATFKDVKTGDIMPPEPYDLLHVAPHMSAPSFIKESPLANANGWLDVNPATLQSTKASNVFGIGDCTSTPNSKTAAAITSQAPVLVHNLAQAIDNKPLNGTYHGYASCPLIVSKNKVILAEFGYGGKLMETFNPDTGKFPLSWIGQDGAIQHRFFYFLKETFFPAAYWTMWTRGWWYGTNGPFKPNVTSTTYK